MGLGPICPKGADLVLQALARFGTWLSWALTLSIVGFHEPFCHRGPGLI